MSSPPKLNELVQDIASLDRQDRIETLISLSEKFKQYDQPEPYPEQNRVPGCESEAFVFTEELSDGKARYHFAVLNPQGISAMAMAVILKDTLDDHEPAVTQGINEEIVYDIFGRELSMGKSGGLMNMIRLLKAQAARLSKDNS